MNYDNEPDILLFQVLKTLHTEGKHVIDFQSTQYSQSSFLPPKFEWVGAFDPSQRQVFTVGKGE